MERSSYARSPSPCAEPMSGRVFGSNDAMQRDTVVSNMDQANEKAFRILESARNLRHRAGSTVPECKTAGDRAAEPAPPDMLGKMADLNVTLAEIQSVLKDIEGVVG